MEEIRIYRSIWKPICFTVLVFIWLFCIVYPIFLVSPQVYWEAITQVATTETGIFIFGGLSFLVFHVIIYFCLRWAYRLLRDRIKHIPYYIITDKSFIINSGKGLEIRFVDVEDFTFKREKVKGETSKWIEIQYKSGVDLKKYDEVTRIETHGLTITPENICELLNERLAAAKKKARNSLYL